MTEDRPKTYGKKGQIIHGQTREIISRITAFMKSEAELFHRTGRAKIPLTHYKQRVLAATGISEAAYKKVMKQSAQVSSGALPYFPTPRYGFSKVKLDELTRISATSTNKNYMVPSQQVPVTPLPLRVIPPLLIINYRKDAEIMKTETSKLFLCSDSIQKTYRCKICSLLTFCHVELLNHFSNVHTTTNCGKLIQLRVFSCVTCDFSTYSELMLLKHFSTGSCTVQNVAH